MLSQVIFVLIERAWVGQTKPILGREKEKARWGPITSEAWLEMAKQTSKLKAKTGYYGSCGLLLHFEYVRKASSSVLLTGGLETAHPCLGFYFTFIPSQALCAIRKSRLNARL